MGLPENLTRLLDERALTNYRLAKDMNISQTTVANWKEGKTFPQKMYLRELANYFGCSESDLTK